MKEILCDKLIKTPLSSSVQFPGLIFYINVKMFSTKPLSFILELSNRLESRDHSSYRRRCAREDRILTNTERRFMLNAERGDCASVAKIIEQSSDNSGDFDINCTDPLGRTALSIAIINENPELIEILLDASIQVKY